jgi:hypothetical protein
MSLLPHRTYLLHALNPVSNTTTIMTSGGYSPPFVGGTTLPRGPTLREDVEAVRLAQVRGNGSLDKARGHMPLISVFSQIQLSLIEQSHKHQI